MVSNRDEIFSILSSLEKDLKKLGVKRIGLFGSFSRGTQTTLSDVDLIVSFFPGYKNYDNFYTLVELLEHHLKRKIELITEESLDPYLKKEIEKDINYYEIAA